MNELFILSIIIKQNKFKREKSENLTRIEKNDLNLIEKIGSGLLGDVYLARFNTLNVALKVTVLIFSKSKHFKIILLTQEM